MMTASDQLRRRVGTNVRRAREAAGLTQHELGTRINEGQTVVSRWERGGAMPRLESLQRLADALEVDVADLFEPLDDERETNGHDAPAAA